MNELLDILLVDDDEVDREMVRKSLRSITAQWTEVATAAQALQALERRRDLVLLDYKLPDMDGLELIGKIKDKAPDTPIILITGFGSEDLVMAAVGSGVLDYVPKSKITPEFMTRTVINDLLIHKSNLEVEKMRRATAEALKDIIRVAKERLADYDS